MKPSPPASLSSRPRRGLVALVDHATIRVADLALGPQGVHCHRRVVAHNGSHDLQWLQDDPASVAEALARVLHEHGLPRRLACLGLSDALFGTALITVPRTTPAALEAILARHVREEAISPDTDLLADLSLLEAAGAPIDKPRKGFVSWASRPLLAGHARALAARNIRVQRMLPPSVALLDLFSRTRNRQAGRIELFVRYMFPSLVIGVYAGREPLYLRVLRDVMADATDGVVGTVLREVLRTTEYTVENHQGRRVERVCHSGLPPAEAVRFAKLLQEASGIAAEPLTVPMTGSEAETEPEQLAALAGLLLHGAPLQHAVVRPMDLQPSQPRRVPRLLATLSLLALVAVGAGLTSLHLAQRTVLAVDAEVAALVDEFSGLSRGAEERTAVLVRAADLPPRRATLDLLAERAGNPVTPLLEALLLVPADARPVFASLDLPYSGEDRRARLDLQLAADFSGPDGATRLRNLSDLLRARSWCANLNVIPGGLRASRRDASLLETVDFGAWLR